MTDGSTIAGQDISLACSGRMNGWDDDDETLSLTRP